MPKGTASQTELKAITPEDLWSENKTFQSKTIAGLRSMESGLSYTTLEEKKKILQYSYETGKCTDTLFDTAWVKGKIVKEVEAYDFSKDETRILLATRTKKIYRHSFTAKYYIWDVETKAITPLSNRPKQQLATFSPDGSKVAFVSGNNLFVKDLETGRETQITADGKKNSIINGAADWVYEEEFGLKRAFEWSSDGKLIAFQRFDENRVLQFEMQRFTGKYPELVTYKYPRAGEDNAVVSVHIYSVADKSTVKVDVGSETDQYIPRIKWIKTSKDLAVLRVNRRQDTLKILLADTKTGKSRVVYQDQNERYLDTDGSLTFLNDGKRILIVSERTGWRRIHLFDIDGKEIQQLTKGDFDITEFHGLNEENGRVYYTAALPTPLERTLCSVKLDGTDVKSLTRTDGCNSTVFSKGLKYYINTFTNSTTPPVITLHTADANLVRQLEDNSALLETLAKYNTTSKEYFKFTTSEGFELNGWMLKPPGFDKTRKYPLIITVYGGPNSQTVMNSWEFGWNNYLAQQGFIVASVDGRGTGARGEEFRKCTYLQLGKYEVIDQIEAAKYLGSLPFVDASRIGVTGWSYGGFMASGCILRGADVFKASVAIASVTNFRYYDTVYTERYMRTPQENPAGYDENAPLSHAENLKGKFLLVHGITDDNVHYQNSLELVEALVKAGKRFEVHFLPNRDHGISGGKTHMHLFTRMTEFLVENL